MTGSANRQLLSGNHAVAWGVKLARPDVAALYPITPQTPILEKITELQLQGEMNLQLLTPESEHSAMSACLSASLTGVRVFTATSSQGLLLMHEVLHYAAGARAPIVMFNVNRTPASPWGFWPDQLDSLSQRDTGWVQLYTESPQESLDTTVQAFRIAESVGLPVMISHDAFYVSHAVEPVELPSQALVDEYLPRVERPLRLDAELGQSFGAPIDQATWNRSRQELGEAMNKVPAAVAAAGSDWSELFGRQYGPLEHYRSDDAQVLIVTMGSMSGTARVAVDALREALAGVPCALVLDRNYSPGMGGILHQELRAALFAMPDAPRVHGLLAGVGGVNVPAKKIQQWVVDYREAEPATEAIWVE